MSTPTTTEIELSLGGMTCASCANRIERKLNKLDGVQASVNYATEKARVQAPADLDPAVLVAQVEAAGYTATLPAPPVEDVDVVAVAGARLHARAARPTGRQRAAHGPRHRAGDGARLPVHVLAVDLADAGRAGRRVGRLAVPPGDVGEPAPRRDDHGHARVDGCARGVRMVGVGAAVRHRRRAGDGAPLHARRLPRRRGGADLPGGRGGRHDVPAGRAVLRGPVEAAGGGGPAGAARAGREGRRRAAGPPRGADPGRAARGRRPVRRAPRGEGRDGRGRRGRPLGRRRGPADRRVAARRRRAGRRRGRRDRERGRPAGRAGHPGRRGHPARADGQAGRRRADRQGARPAAGRPDLRRVRADRDRAGGRHLRVLARHGRGCRGGVHRRGRRPDHRLPVRTGARDADGAAGRHRARREAGHPDQGPGGAGGDPAGRHRRAGQDRHGDGGPHGRWSRCTSTPTPIAARRRRGGEALRLAAAVEAASEHPVAAAIVAAAPGDLPPVESLRERRGARRAGRGRRPRRAGRASGAARAVEHRPAADAGRGPGRRPGPGTHRGGGGVGRRRAGGARGRRHREADLGRGGRPAARAGPAPGAADRRQRRGRTRGRRRGRHRPRIGS